jgi:hypothetical protein
LRGHDENARDGINDDGEAEKHERHEYQGRNVQLPLASANSLAMTAAIE